MRPATIVQVAVELSQPLSKIVYHTTVLRNTGYVQPVEDQDPDALEPLYEAARS